MGNFGNDANAPTGLFDACQNSPEALRAWCRSRPNTVLISALDAIYMHHMQQREVIQHELNERRERRNFRYTLIAILVAVLALIVALVALVR